MSESNAVPDASKSETSETWASQEESDFAHRVMRENGTEPPFYTDMWRSNKKGTYHCRGCDSKLFKSSDKFTSACGWPAFTKSIDSETGQSGVKSLPNSDILVYLTDESYGMQRIEVRCKLCDAHLGHVFEEPGWTQQRCLTEDQLRYCINSVCLCFKPDSDKS